MDVRTEILQEIADKVLRVDTLTTRNSDEQDFYELAVWNIKEALELAYEEGKTRG